MTQVEIAYRYGGVPDEGILRTLDRVREVYGIRRITFDETARLVRVEFDASRLKEPVVAAMLRRAGIDLVQRVALAETVLSAPAPKN